MVSGEGSKGSPVERPGGKTHLDPGRAVMATERPGMLGNLLHRPTGQQTAPT